MLSRVAEMVYWMQRYRERAENTARLIEVNFHLNLDIPLGQFQQWGTVLKVTESAEAFAKRYKDVTESNVIHFLTFDTENPNSILSCLHRARENAKAVREIIPPDMWQELNTAYLFVRNAPDAHSVFRSPYHFYTRIKRQCQLFTGIADTTMSHNVAWHVGRVGYLLERADMTTRILDVKYFILLPTAEHVGTPYDDLQWAALLKSASAFEMYRQTWHQIEPARIVDFLVRDRDFPRAIHSTIARAMESLSQIPRPEGIAAEKQPEALLQRLQKDLVRLRGADIVAAGLHEFLNDIQLRVIEIHNSIYDTFFALRPAEGLKATDRGVF